MVFISASKVMVGDKKKKKKIPLMPMGFLLPGLRTSSANQAILSKKRKEKKSEKITKIVVTLVATLAHATCSDQNISIEIRGPLASTKEHQKERIWCNIFPFWRNISRIVLLQ